MKNLNILRLTPFVSSNAQSVPVGYFVDAPIEMIVKVSESKSSGGIPGFVLSNDGRRYYYNKIDAMTKVLDNGYNYYISNSSTEWDQCLFCQRFEDYSDHSEYIENRSSDYKYERISNFEYKTSMGKIISKTEENYYYYKSYDYSNSRGETTSWVDTDEIPNSYESEEDIFSYSGIPYRVGEDATEMSWSQFRDESTPRQEVSSVTENPPVKCDNCSGWFGSGSYSIESEQTKTYHESQTLSEKITPELRASWAEEFIQSDRAPNFGEIKNFDVGMKTASYNVYSGNPIAEKVMTFANGKLVRSAFKFRVTSAPPSGMRYYYRFLKTTIPYDEISGNFLYEQYKEESTVKYLDSAFIEECLRENNNGDDEDDYPSEEIQVEYLPGEGESKYGKVAVSAYGCSIYYDPSLVSITYADAYDVNKDDGTPYRDANDAHWQQDDSYTITACPLVYVANKPLKVATAVVNMNGEIPPGTALVLTGAYPGGKIEMKTTVSETISSGVVTFSGSVGTGAVSTTVDYIESLPVNWTIGVNKDQPLSVSGDQENEVYVTLGEPFQKEDLYETVLYIACKAGSGRRDRGSLISAIWRVFETRSVKDKNNIPLQYYGMWYEYDYTVPYTTTAGLLKYKNGQCGAWTKFFLDCLMVNESNKENTGSYYVMIGWMPDIENPYGILVKEWSFGDSKTSGNVEWPYINIYESESRENPLYEEVRRLSYSAGQNNVVTPDLFNNHQFAKSDGLKDPSYGIKSDMDYEMGISGCFYDTTRAVDERFYGIDFNKDGIFSVVTMPVRLFKKKGVPHYEEPYP